MNKEVASMPKEIHKDEFEKAYPIYLSANHVYINKINPPIQSACRDILYTRMLGNC